MTVTCSHDNIENKFNPYFSGKEIKNVLQCNIDVKILLPKY